MVLLDSLSAWRDPAGKHGKKRKSKRACIALSVIVKYNSTSEIEGGSE
jgi:ribosomal protein L32E